MPWIIGTEDDMQRLITDATQRHAGMPRVYSNRGGGRHAVPEGEPSAFRTRWGRRRLGGAPYVAVFVDGESWAEGLDVTPAQQEWLDTYTTTLDGLPEDTWGTTEGASPTALLWDPQAHRTHNPWGPEWGPEFGPGQ